MMIRALGSLLRPVISLFFRRRFIAAFRTGGDPALWIVDIDNTVADTWRSFSREHSSEAERLSSLPPLKGMCGKIADAVPGGVSVLFLSVRPYWTYFLTRKWLKDQGLSVGVSNLVLVTTPEEKLDLLKAGLAANPALLVEYYDDLSYNQEAGETRFYDHIIEKVKRLPLKYAGYEEISAINGTDGKIHR